MITLVYSLKQHLPKNMQHSVRQRVRLGAQRKLHIVLCSLCALMIKGVPEVGSRGGAQPPQILKIQKKEQKHKQTLLVPLPPNICTFRRIWNDQKIELKYFRYDNDARLQFYLCTKNHNNFFKCMKKRTGKKKGKLISQLVAFIHYRIFRFD